MENLLNLPQATIVNKTVPKNAFYKHASEGHRAYFQRLLTDEFDTITWLYKLTATTLNVADGEQVHEIDVFVCQMKRNGYSLNPFCGLDDILPRHTLFVILYGESCDIIMHHKQRRADGKWIRGVTEMQRGIRLDDFRLKLEGQNVDAIYNGLLSQLSGMQITSQEEYTEKTELRQKALNLEKQIDALQKKIRAEKQFNRQVAMNGEARKLKKELEEIKKNI